MSVGVDNMIKKMISKNPSLFVSILCIAIVIAICIPASIYVQNENISTQTLSKMGSRGDEVKQIQTKLKNLGLYDGSIDGIYGSKTLKGVKAFQKSKGISVDGIAGTQTLKLLGIKTSSSGGHFNDNDAQLLAKVISAEARGEGYTGQVAVGAVVLNRVEHPSFPDTLSGVVYQAGAFSAVRDSNWKEPIQESAYRAAKDAINGQDPTGGAIYYYNPQKTSNKWIRTRPEVITIGEHVFCK